MTKQFSNYSDLLTFTRASKGHALRPVSYGTELVTNGDFSTDSDWTKGTGWTISNGVADLDGSQGGNSDLSQSLTLKANAIYQLSVEVTAVTTALQYVTITNTGGAELDSLSTTGTYTAIFVAPSTSENLNIRGTSSSVSTIDNVSVKEVLFDQPDGTLTLFEHPDNVPRVEYDADGNRLGLLVEEARTNLITYSTPDSNWTPSRVTITENNAVSPDGTENATRINETTATNSHYISGNETSVTSGLNYTLSVYVKADTSTACQLLFSSTGFGSSQYANFDLSTGTVGYEAANATATIQDVGNGWYRCAITSTATATTFSIVGFVVFVNNNASSSTRIPPYAGNTAHQMYVYGAQVEEASFPTSYIKNEGTSSGATRSADVASIPVADFGYNTDVGSVVAEYTPTKVNGDVRGVFEIAASTSSNRAYHSASEGNHWLVRSEGATPAAIDIGTVSENTNKVAAVYKKDDFAVSVNGASVGTDTSGNVPISIIEINIGALQNGFHLNGHIKSIKYYPRRLTNAQLVQLTS